MNTLEDEIIALLDSLKVEYDWHEPLGELLIYNHNGHDYTITIDSYELAAEEIAAHDIERTA